MSYLLDVNILIARSAPNHALVVNWFRSIGNKLVATCPIVENGFVRIFGNPNYTGGPGSVAKAMQNLRLIRSMPQHCFISDHLSVADPKVYINMNEVSCKQLTDIYLLGIAKEKGLKFATLDGKIKTKAVAGGSASLEVINKEIS